MSFTRSITPPAPAVGLDHGNFGFWKLARLTMSQVGPNVLSNFATFSTETVNTLFIGHYGNEDELAAVGLGNMVQNCFGLSIIIGLASALDTLASQAHGAGRCKLACVCVQRARVLTGLQLLWVLPVLALSHEWLGLLGQDPEVARLVGTYNRATAIFLVFFVQVVTLERLLAAFLRPTAPCVVSVVCSIFHVAWCALFVGRLNLSILGLALANGITWFSRASLLIAYTAWNAESMGLRPGWVIGVQRGAFQDWRGFMRVAMPALAQTCGEWWFFEIVALIVGYLGATVLAAHTAAMNVYTMAFMVPISISSSSAALIGNALGAGTPALARRVIASCTALTLTVWVFLAGAVALSGTLIAEAYSRDEPVRAVMRSLLLILCVTGFPDACQNVLGGTLRGLGKLRSASVIYLVSFYVIMLPVTILSALKFGYGVQGAWWAMGLGPSIASLCFAVVIYRTDFSELASQISNGMSSEVEVLRS